MVSETLARYQCVPVCEAQIYSVDGSVFYEFESQEAVTEPQNIS